jgi:hypothetical protein
LEQTLSFLFLNFPYRRFLSGPHCHPSVQTTTVTVADVSNEPSTNISSGTLLDTKNGTGEDGDASKSEDFNAETSADTSPASKPLPTDSNVVGEIFHFIFAV